MHDTGRYAATATTDSREVEKMARTQESPFGSWNRTASADTVQRRLAQRAADSRAPRRRGAPSAGAPAPFGAWYGLRPVISLSADGYGSVRLDDGTSYAVTMGGIAEPGRYERSAPWVPLAHSRSLDGSWSEEIYESVYDEVLSAEIMEVDAEDRMIWHLASNTVAIILYYSDQGFVSGEELDAQALEVKRALAEQIAAESDDDSPDDDDDDDDDDDNDGVDNANPHVDKVILPATWASGLINGDWSSFKLSEVKRAREVEQAYAEKGWSFVDVSEPYFSWSYRDCDAGANVSGGDVAEYTLLKHS